MYARMHSYFAKNAPAFEHIVPLKTEIGHFNMLNDRLEAQATLQVKDIAPLKAEKERLRGEWIEMLMESALIARAWALVHYPELVHVFHTSFRYFGRLPENTCLAAGEEMLRHLREHQAALLPYGVSPEMLEEAEQKAAYLRHILPSVGEAKKSKKKVTRDIANTLNSLEASLQVIDALIRGRFSRTEPGLWQEYRIMRTVGKYVRRHTGLRVRLLSELTGEPLAGARACIRELGRSANGDADGFLEIIGFNTGKYHIDIYVDDEHVKTIIRSIPRGRIVEFEELI